MVLAKSHAPEVAEKRLRHTSRRTTVCVVIFRPVVRETFCQRPTERILLKTAQARSRTQEVAEKRSHRTSKPINILRKHCHARCLRERTSTVLGHSALLWLTTRRAWQTISATSTRRTTGALTNVRNVLSTIITT